MIQFRPGGIVNVDVKLSPTDQKPARFFVIALSGEEAVALSERQAAGRTAAGRDAKAASAAIYDELRKVLTGWENFTDAKGQRIEFDPQRLEKEITLGGAQYLLARAVKADEDDLGK